jgi:hypothetical protein
MSLQVRMLIASLALAAAVGGCDRGWQEFQRVELGKPMPADSLLRPEKNKDPNGVPSTAPSTDGPKTVLLVWSDWGAWPVPMSTGWHVVAVRADDEGRAIAKSYCAELWSNYLLVTVPAMRRVVELQVPPRVLLEPTDEEVDEYRVGTENCRTLRSYILNAMHEVDPGSAFWLRPPPLLLAFLSGVNYMTFTFAHGGFYGFYGLEGSIKDLPMEGITRQGYDRTFSPEVGGSIRIQNLGQGRIRVEMNLLRIYDPLALVGYLYMQ